MTSTWGQTSSGSFSQQHLLTRFQRSSILSPLDRVGSVLYCQEVPRGTTFRISVSLYGSVKLLRTFLLANVIYTRRMSGAKIVSKSILGQAVCATSNWTAIDQAGRPTESVFAGPLGSTYYSFSCHWYTANAYPPQDYFNRENGNARRSLGRTTVCLIYACVVPLHVYGEACVLLHRIQSPMSNSDDPVAV